MPPRVTVIDAHPDHVAAFREGCREADRREWEDALGTDLETAMRIAVRYPKAIARAAFDAKSGELLACWGAHAMQGAKGVGQLWFAGREVAYAKVHGIHFHWKAEMAAMHARWPTLVAYSDERQPKHHTWLERMGFERLTWNLKAPSTTYRMYRRRIA